MIKREHEIIRDGVVVLDDAHITNCDIQSCTLAYAGGELPIVTNNKIAYCQFILVGPAKRTLEYMRALYQAGLTGVVDSWIDSIKRAPTDSVLAQVETEGGMQ